MPGGAGGVVAALDAEVVALGGDVGEWSRTQEMFNVLRGDQRRWAEAWYDAVLSASRGQGGQPRGLSDALGWSPAKTKSVSRRARMRMAAFIDERGRGVVCEERRALLDAFILAGRDPAGAVLDDVRREAMLLHLAGCDDCRVAWHARRRALLGRLRVALVMPLDGVAVAWHTLADKLGGLVAGAHLQASSLLARIGIGGAAAAGGGAATIGGKAAAVCVGVVCAATAGGEIAGVLPPIAIEPAKPAHRVERRAAPASKAIIQQAVAQTAPTAAESAAGVKASVRETLAKPKASVAPAWPNGLPPASATTAPGGSGGPLAAAGTSSDLPRARRATPDPAQGPAASFSTTSSLPLPEPPPAPAGSGSSRPAPPPVAGAHWTRTRCAPGSRGC